MCSVLDLTTLTQDYPSIPFIPNYPGYMKSNGRLQKNVINTISFLTGRECKGSILVVVVSDWRECDTNIIRSLLPEIEEIHVWTRDRRMPSNKEKGIQVRYNRPSRLSYEGETRKMFLLCSIRGEMKNTLDDSEVQDYVMNNVKFEAALVRFRPLSRDKNSSYSFREGIVTTICFIQACSLDTYITIEKDSVPRQYNVKDHMDRMFYYNTVVRLNVIDNMSFDERYCLEILKRHLKRSGKSEDCFNMWSDIVSLTTNN